MVAAIAGDLEAADRVELDLPETGVCSSNIPVDSDRVDSNDGCCGTPTAETATIPAGRGLATGDRREIGL